MLWGVIAAVACAVCAEVVFQAGVAAVGHAILWPAYRARPEWDPSELTVAIAGMLGIAMLVAGISALVFQLS